MKNFEELKALLLSEVNGVIEMDEVPPVIIVNWDHIAINYVPVSSWTMGEEDTKKLPKVINDKLPLHLGVFNG